MDTTEQMCTEFNPHKGQKSPITGTNDGTLVEVGSLLNAEVLKDILLSGKESISIHDTIINNIPYIIHRTDFPDDGDFSNRYRFFFINSETYQIDRLSFHASYYDQTQIDDIILSDFRYNTLEYNELENKFNQIVQLYERKVYEPRKFESLSIGEEVPELSGKSFPDNQEVTLSSKKKIIIYDFWYTACLPCAKIIPEMNKLYEKYQGEVEFYAINVSIEDFEKQ